MTATDTIGQAKWDVMSANHILAREGVLDGYGHVSMRHPDNPEHFLLSRSRSPELVTVEDIMEFTLDGDTVGNDDRPPYLERFIHGAIYRARPDVVLGRPLAPRRRHPVLDQLGAAAARLASGLLDGRALPVWDIHDKFGDTNMLVTNIAQGDDLARRSAATRSR